MDEYPLIKGSEYKGISYSIHFSTTNNMFSVCDLIIASLDNNKDIEKLEKATHEAIDKFLSETPQNFDGWLDLFSTCLEWTGYEDCELNKNLFKMTLDKYTQWFLTTKQKGTI